MPKIRTPNVLGFKIHNIVSIGKEHAKQASSEPGPGILNIPQNRKHLKQQRIVPLPTQLSNGIQYEKLVLGLEPNSFLNIYI